MIAALGASVEGGFSASESFTGTMARMYFCLKIFKCLMLYSRCFMSGS